MDTVRQICQPVNQSFPHFPQARRVLFAPHPHRFVVLSLSLPGVYAEISYHGDNLLFSDDWWNWAPFHMFIGHFNIFFMNCICKSLSIFSIGLSLRILYIKCLLKHISFSHCLKPANAIALTLGFHRWLTTAWSFQALETLFCLNREHETNYWSS